MCVQDLQRSARRRGGWAARFVARDSICCDLSGYAMESDPGACAIWVNSGSVACGRRIFGLSTKGQTRREAGTQSYGTHAVSRATESKGVSMSPTRRLEVASALPGSRTYARVTRGITPRPGLVSGAARGESPVRAVALHVYRNTQSRHGDLSTSTVARPAAVPVELLGSGAASGWPRLGHGSPSGWQAAEGTARLF
jgi:hypothetical protein